MKIIFSLICALSFCPLLFGAKHNGPSYDTKPRNALDSLGERLAKKYNMKMLNTGLGYLADAPKATWCINFVNNQNLTIEQAEPIAANLVRAVLYEMYHNPLFNAYFLEVNKQRTNPKTKESILNNEKMSFKIAFWDANVNRPLYPYLAQIRFTGTAIYFHYADPQTQALQEPIVKTLEDLQINENQYR